MKQAFKSKMMKFKADYCRLPLYGLIFCAVKRASSLLRSSNTNSRKEEDAVVSLLLRLGDTNIRTKCLSPYITIILISLQDIVTKFLVNYRPLCE